MEWKNRENGMGAVLNNNEGKVFLSYQPNKYDGYNKYCNLDSANPETAIVLIGDKKNGQNRYLIFRGDRRKELTPLYPDIEKLKEYWKKEGGHFWSDSLED
ncbi:MAG: hypothetical protein ACP5N7_05895 [Candidatus Pacearchaeota archaeon]